ncbi:uncharacterized protein LOC126579317 [Anopheles aquasalis]|uniref:uncharacterized protein LOC126579317 n=1 Tax=Anopheles aquasalis TaxID=42839 RepID=UPI00215AA269|nr:uncharacterized protein LOC126579317 [Anopheles aquasalis]
MKTFVAIVIVALIAGSFALTIDQKKKAEGYAAECVKTSGVAPETAAKLKNGDFAGADDKTKCFAKCFLEKAGFMTDKGEIDEKTVIQKLSVDHDQAKVEGLVKKCNHKEANPCETAFKAYQCIYAAKGASLLDLSISNSKHLAQRTMQLYVVAIVLASVALATVEAAEDGTVQQPQEQPDLEDVGKIVNGETFALQCLLESGLKLDSLATLTAADLTDSGSKIKCLVKCFFEKTGFMDGQGKLQQDVVVEQLSKFMPKERVETLVKNCDIQEVDPCDTAYKVTECYFQNKAGLF